MALLGINLSPAMATPDNPPLSSAATYKKLNSVVTKISGNPKNFKKTNKTGHAWATKNLKESYSSVKNAIWIRYGVRISEDVKTEVVAKAVFEAKSLEIYKENLASIDWANKQIFMWAGNILQNQANKCNFGVDVLAKENQHLRSVIAGAVSFKNKKHKNKKYKNKRNKAKTKKNLQRAQAALEKNAEELKQAKKKEADCIYQREIVIAILRGKITNLAKGVEAFKQAFLSNHLERMAAIAEGLKNLKIYNRTATNSLVTRELEIVTKLVNRGRAGAGLSLLPVIPPKLQGPSVSQNEFFGMMNGGNLDYQKAAQSGVGTARVNMMWYLANNPTGGSPNWSAQDSMFKEFSKNGIRVIPTFYGNRLGGPESMRVSSGAWKEYQKYIGLAVDRYGPGGVFWKENPGVPYIPVRAWEVWNEPNFDINNPGGENVSPKLYVQILVRASKTIKKRDPAAIVLFGGLANPSEDRTVKIKGKTKTTAMTAANFLKAVYKYPEARGSFDALSFHPYAGSVSRMSSSIASMRKILDDNGDANKSIYITEVGWATDNDPSRSPNALVVSPKKQASMLTESMNWFKANRSKYKIQTVIWYFWQDVSGAIYGGKKNWDSYAGLFYLNGQPKPAWYAWLKATGGS